MAPRQLRLEPIEADSTADKGAKRVRVDSTEDSSTQVLKIPPARQPDARPGSHRALLPSLTTLARAPALGTGCECSKDPFGSRCTLPYYHNKKRSTTTPFALRGFSKFKCNSNSFVKFQKLTLRLTPSTNNLLTTFCTVFQMVPSSSDPFLPTAAELAGEDPAVRRPTDGHFCL
eukprot:scaffold6371_cov110-Isochrysis_galbana.AAC.7